MTENRNNSSLSNQDGRGTVCIDTHRVLDSCRDRDCFENVRVYLNAFGEETLSCATNIRARSAKVLWAFVGVDEVPFNCGFFQISIRYYILVDLEACLGLGRSQNFHGIAVLEKNVILYGGEGSVTTFTSGPDSTFCAIGNTDNRGSTNPVAIAETVEPIVLNTRIVTDCGCTCQQNETIDLPDCISDCLGGPVCCNTNGPRLYITFGMFSVIRIVRPAQLLVQATDYSVPDKECVPLSSDEDPCAAFNNMPFPIARFRGTSNGSEHNSGSTRGNCGCQSNRDNR